MSWTTGSALVGLIHGIAVKTSRAVTVPGAPTTGVSNTAVRVVVGRWTFCRPVPGTLRYIRLEEHFSTPQHEIPRVISPVADGLRCTVQKVVHE